SPPSEAVRSSGQRRYRKHAAAILQRRRVLPAAAEKNAQHTGFRPVSEKSENNVPPFPFFS
ncbi:hypothetical protein, partial [Alistipes finegoldii]|uniref:hypothetical protein n=1 Tax=Alistipes finegoldii TaxID=214856 RepID=UPI003AF6AD0E